MMASLKIYGYSNIHLLLLYIKRHISEVTWLKSGSLKEIQMAVRNIFIFFFNKFFFHTFKPFHDINFVS